MNRFDRRRGTAAESRTASGPPPTVLHGDEPFEVACDPAQQDALWKATGARRGTPVMVEMRATLAPEGGEDAPAIGVQLAGLRVGALDPDDAAELLPGLLAVMLRNNTDVAVRGRVVGGATERVGDKRQLDVWIYLDPIDFGFDPPALEAIRTGHSVAADPQWAGALPRGLAERVRFLRSQLKTESSPLQRHLMFNALEDALFHARDSGPLAFGEYEEAVTAHDAEMPTILPALFAQFGGVPELPAYAQLARMLARRHRVADAFRWALRGLELYGEHGTNAAAVDDLRARAAALGQGRGRPLPPSEARPLAASAGPLAEPSDQVVRARVAQPAGAPPNWYPDPTGHADLRFWDGARWTQHVSTGGITGVDLLP